jgi:hypothetical protein
MLCNCAITIDISCGGQMMVIALAASVLSFWRGEMENLDYGGEEAIR